MKRNSKPQATWLPSPSGLLKHLSRNRQDVARALFENPRAYVLLSVRKAGRKLGVDPATALRIVHAMGFSRYRDFQHYLHELSIARATSLDTMPRSLGADSTGNVRIRQVLRHDLVNLQNLTNTLDIDSLVAVARKLHSAKRIVVLGGDLAASLAYFLRYHLVLLGLPAVSASGPGEVIHTVRTTGKGDMVIAISFRRGLRHTVEGLKHARMNQAYCVGITDTYLSPITRFAHECYIASVETPSFGASYAAPMALLNALIVSCAATHPRRTMRFIKLAAQEQKTGYRWYPEE